MLIARLLKIGFLYLPLSFYYIIFLLGCDTDANSFHNTDTPTQQTTLTQKPEQPIILHEIPKIPKEVQDYTTRYYEYLHKQNKSHTKAQRNKEAMRLDTTFTQLRQQYKNNKTIMETLEAFACILPDCSAIQQGKIYFYPYMTIIEAYNAILMDKQTHIFTFFDIMKHYNYVLTSMQTTSIDLQAQYTQQTPFQTLKFTWNGTNRLDITLTPKEEICKPYIYIYQITFIQDSNGVQVKQHKEKLSAFSYPSDLVAFVAKSCACARVLGYIDKLTIEEEKIAKHALQPHITHCENIATERKDLWDKYMRDSRIIRILQHEQQLYPND